jgi:energy-converting hydrogenase A subunit M
MAPDRDAIINIRTSQALRNRLLGRVRARGTTLRSFLADVIEIIDTDDELFEMIEMRRLVLGRQRDSHQSLSALPLPQGEGAPALT